MDNELIEKIKTPQDATTEEDGTKTFGLNIYFSKTDPNLVIIEPDKDGSKIEHKLKQLKELYSEKDNQDKTAFTNLLMNIEKSITVYYHEHRDLTDQDVIRVLDKLSMKPETEDGNELQKSLISSLKISLSMMDYSRGDTKRALKKVLRSVERHNSDAGKTGYLEFIDKYIKNY